MSGLHIQEEKETSRDTKVTGRGKEIILETGGGVDHCDFYFVGGKASVSYSLPFRT